MKKTLKIFKWFSIVVGVILIGFIIFLHTIDFSPSDEEIQEAFSRVSYQPEYHTYVHNGRSIHYAAIGDTSKPIAFFVHGSPGSWDAFLWFMSQPDVLEKYRVISVDRPGFGKSDSGIPERSLQKQAADIAQILITQKRKPTILIGHSYGGPVIMRMAMDYPGLVDGLILVAASVNPELEKTKWFQVPVHYKAFSWILPDMLFVSNEEIIALKAELKEMLPLWSQITIPVSVIQGENDDLVPPANADFAQKMLTNAPVKMVLKPGLNHFIPWTKPDLILRELNTILPNTF